MKTRYKSMAALLEILMGIIFMAMAFGMFIIPLDLAAGGVTGFSKIIVRIIPIPLSLMVFLINIMLLMLGLCLVGKSFFIKTVAVSILFPILLGIFSGVGIAYPSNHLLVGSVLAGIILGIGVGLVLRSGASAGGFDVVAVILNKKWGIAIAMVMNLCDVFIILAQVSGASICQSLYGVMTISISAMVVNKLVKQKDEVLHGEVRCTY